MSKPPPPEKSRIDTFKEAAKQLKADREDAFDRILRRVTKAHHSLSDSKRLAHKVKAKP